MNHEWKKNYEYRKRTYIPWWEVFVAVDISKTIFIKDVDWETCQWMPVPCDFSGGTLLTSIIKSKSRFKWITKVYIPSNINYKVPHWSVADKKRWVEAANTFARDVQIVGGIIKLSTASPRNVWICIYGVHVCWTEVDNGKYENAPITAIPLNVEAASRVGGFLASPISWV